MIAIIVNAVAWIAAAAFGVWLLTDFMKTERQLKAAEEEGKKREK